MKYDLTIKTYTLKELYKIFPDCNRHNFKRNVQQILNDSGYKYTWIDGHGVSIEELPKDTLLELGTILNEKYDLHCSTKSLRAIAAFTILMMKDEDFRCMPWRTKLQVIEKRYSITVSVPTLRKILKALVKKDVFISLESENEYWKTESCGNGNKVQSPVKTKREKKKLNKYLKLRKQYLESSPEDFKSSFGKVVRHLWNLYNHVYYKCIRYIPNIISDDLEYLENLCMSFG